MEHIIPLSLGGKNGFTIQVKATANAELGKELDGALNKDFLINTIRRKKGYKGHSKEIPKYKVDATIEGTNERVVVYYEGKENYLFNPGTRKRYTEEEKRQIILNPVVPYDRFIRIRFAAKVILGAGYFIYGERFRKYADHKNLRRIMKFDLVNKKGKVINVPIGIMEEHAEIADKDIKWQRTFKDVFKSIDCSGVIFVIGPNQIIAAVGIGGNYIAAINFEAKGEHFGYKEGPPDGIIVGIQNGKIIKTSFHKYLIKLIKRSSSASVAKDI